MASGHEDRRSRAGGGAGAAAAGRSVSGAPWAEVGGRGAHLLISRCQTVIAIFRDEANGGEQSAARSVVLAANSVQILQKCNLTQTQHASLHAHHLVSPHPCNARQTRRRIDIAQSRRADPFPHAHRAPPALPLRVGTPKDSDCPHRMVLKQSRRNIDLLFHSHSPKSAPRPSTSRWMLQSTSWCRGELSVLQVTTNM